MQKRNQWTQSRQIRWVNGRASVAFAGIPSLNPCWGICDFLPFCQSFTFPFPFLLFPFPFSFDLSFKSSNLQQTPNYQRFLIFNFLSVPSLSTSLFLSRSCSPLWSTFFFSLKRTKMANAFLSQTQVVLLTLLPFVAASTWKPKDVEKGHVTPYVMSCDRQTRFSQNRGRWTYLQTVASDILSFCTNLSKGFFPLSTITKIECARAKLCKSNPSFPCFIKLCQSVS